MNNKTHDIDVVIIGGGVAGLWLLDEMIRKGYEAVLLESHSLGRGQTLCAQGIIHGGLKYTLKGMMTGSADAIREMPIIWRECLNGEREPNLNDVKVRSDFCYLWRTNRMSSKLGMVGARVGLRVSPEVLAEKDVPEVLKGCPGQNYRLNEQVIDPASLLGSFAKRNVGRIYKIDVEDGFEIKGEGGKVDVVQVSEENLLRPRLVVFTAGAGNGGLREMVGLSGLVMQKRPLHMVMVKGEGLSELNGHCVDGGATRMTITSDYDVEGRVVWQLGGQVAEKGVEMSEAEVIEFAKAELKVVLPGLEQEGLVWGAYRVDRAEGKVEGGGRPADVQVIKDGNCLTVWPTKMALAPRVAEKVMGMMGEPGGFAEVKLDGVDRAEVALAPWERGIVWKSE